jgi:hypothetical protein
MWSHPIGIPYTTQKVCVRLQTTTETSEFWISSHFCNFILSHGPIVTVLWIEFDRSLKCVSSWFFCLHIPTAVGLVLATARLPHHTFLTLAHRLLCCAPGHFAQWRSFSRRNSYTLHTLFQKRLSLSSQFINCFLGFNCPTFALEKKFRYFKETVFCLDATRGVFRPLCLHL